MNRKRMIYLENLMIEDIELALSKFYSLFDIVRVVDPVKKQVISCDDTKKASQLSTCYDFWKRGEQCNNCVSARAMNEKDTFTKVEYNDDRAFLIMASPIIVGEDGYVVELLKDITETGIINALEEKNKGVSNDIISELNKKVVTDDLTGIFNRRYINERLPEDIYNGMYDNKRISVIMLDIDSFKDINDTYGHIAGDKVIKELCDTMNSKIIKEHGWAARYGGEEFLIVLVDTDREEAYKFAEEIRMTLEEKVINYEDRIIQITVSIGSYTVEPGTKSFDEVLKIVDKNLYKAKERGRNITISS